MSMTPGPRSNSRGQTSWTRSMARGIGGGSRDNRLGGRRGRQVEIVVRGVSSSHDDLTDSIEISGFSRSSNPTDLVRATGLLLQTSQLDSELDQIFSQLQSLDDNITKTNGIIDELKQSTRSSLRQMV